MPIWFAGRIISISKIFYQPTRIKGMPLLLQDIGIEFRTAFTIHNNVLHYTFYKRVRFNRQRYCVVGKYILNTNEQLQFVQYFATSQFRPSNSFYTICRNIRLDSCTAVIVISFYILIVHLRAFVVRHGLSDATKFAFF